MDISCPRAEMRSANSYLVVTCGPKVVTKLCQIFFTIVSNLCQSCPKVVPKLSMVDLKMLGGWIINISGWP